MTTPGSNKWGGDASALRFMAPAGHGPPVAAIEDADHEAASPAAEPASAAPQGRWSRSPNVVDRRTLLGVMVLPPEGAAVVLMDVAAYVWDALAQPTAGEALAERLVSRRAAPTAAEVADALRHLQAMGAVREMR